jgi:DNA primase
MSFLIEAVAEDVDLSTPTGKSEAVERLLPFLQEIPDPVQRAAWVAEVAQQVRLDERSIENRLTAPRPPRRAPRQRTGAEAALLDEGAGPAPLDGGGGPLPGRPPAPGTDLEGYILGALLAAPRRLRDVNSRLRSDAQPPLAADDFDSAVARDLLAAVRHASLGVPPPDAPAEQRLDTLPAVHAELAASLLARAEAEPPTTEPARVASLHRATLRLREQARRRALEALRFLQADAAGDDRADHVRSVAALAAELATLQKLLSREQVR